MLFFKNSKQQIKKKNYKTYFVFLGFTSFLWFILQFSKNYTKTVTFTINYAEVENQKIVKSSSDRTIELLLEGSGLQLLKFSFFDNNINLDARKAKIHTDEEASFSGIKLLNLIKIALDYKGEISFTNKDDLKIYYDLFSEKMIPVQIYSSINYKSGFTSIKGVTTTHDTVKVIGPKSLIDTLSNVPTQLLKLTSVSNDYKGSLKLNTFQNIQIIPNEIPIKLQVDKLTEGEIEVPIRLKGISGNNKIQLFPKEVTVIFNVTLKDYSRLSAKDFIVNANIDNVNPDNTKLLLVLEQSPNFVYNARLSFKEVQYVIIK